jgi:hypothetical protein
MFSLEPVRPEDAAGDATVQMWRTIPLREGVMKGPLQRGEFTIMAGVAKAVAQATELITIWDQYFWSAPLARLLAARLNATPTLRLLIVLPPYGTTHVSEELGLRKHALQTLWKDLRPEARKRVKVFDLWDWSNNRGIYVHAKVQTYDDSLLVCGSGNMNRRSFECDAELDCAVLHQPTVRAHLQALHACVMMQGGGGMQRGYEVPRDHPTDVGSLPVPSWEDFGEGWLQWYWEEMRPAPKKEVGKLAGALIEDPLFKEDPGNPRTPNGVDMPSSLPDLIKYIVYEPSSIYGFIGSAIYHSKGGIPVFGPGEFFCQYSCPGDPKAAGRLDEVTFLIERWHEGSQWPWRMPAPR